jgi:hypothetical protein
VNARLIPMILRSGFDVRATMIEGISQFEPPR